MISSRIYSVTTLFASKFPSQLLNTTSEEIAFVFSIPPNTFNSPALIDLNIICEHPGGATGGATNTIKLRIGSTPTIAGTTEFTTLTHTLANGIIGESTRLLGVSNSSIYSHPSTTLTPTWGSSTSVITSTSFNPYILNYVIVTGYVSIAGRGCIISHIRAVMHK